MNLNDIETALIQALQGESATITTEIQIGNTTFPLSAEVNPDDAVVQLETDFADGSPPAFSDLVSLLGIDDFMQSLPQVLRDGLDIEVARVAFEIAVQEKTLTSVSCTLSLPDVSTNPPSLTIAETGLSITVTNPLDGTTRSIEGVLSGTISLGSVAVEVSAEMPGELVLTGTIPKINLSVLAEALLQSVSLPVDLLDLVFADVAFSVTPETGAFSLSGTSASDWDLPVGVDGLSISDVALAVNRAVGEDDKMAVSGSIGGTLNIGSASLAVTYDFPGEVVLTGTIPQINLTAILDKFLPNNISLPDEVPDFAFSDVEISLTPSTGEFSLSGTSANDWDLPVGVDGLSISDVALAINRAVGEDDKMAVSGSIGGTLNIGSVSLAATYNFPGEFVLTATLPSFSLSPLVQDLCGGDLVRDLPVPVSVLNVEFTDIIVSIAPQEPSFSLAGQSSFGQTELVVKKVGKKWGFAVGFAPPASWKFSNIDDALAVLDGLSFAGTTLIVSSSDDDSFDLTTIGPAGDDIQVARGLNFYADIDLSGLGVDELIGLASLNVYAAIGPTPADLVIGASIEGEFALAKNVAFGNIVFQLRPDPSNFSLQLMGELSVVLDDSPLLFVGGLIITVTPSLAAAFTVTMEGSWVEPFGTKGVIVSDVALDLGLRFGPPVPTIGIAGTLELGGGAISGSVAVKFDAANPGKSMLAVAINRLFLNDVITVFCGPAARSIPKSLSKTVLNMGMEDVDIYIVPQPTQIGTLQYEQGFTVQGTINLWGVSAYIYVNIDYTRGVIVQGEIDQISVAGGLFALTGAGNKSKASIDLNLRQGEPFYFNISGAVSLLGLKQEVEVIIDDGGFSFTVSGKIFNLFEVTMTASGSDPTKGGGFMIAATMQNDLFEYLQEKASQAIDDASKGAMAEIAKAQKILDRAQNKVNQLDGSITSMKNTIQKERERDTRNLQNARKAVTSAQNKVNSLNGQISSKKDRINKLKDDIKKKKKWYRKKKAKRAYRWPEYSAYAAKKGAEISGLYAAIGGLETAKRTAQGALEVAKQALRGMEAAAKTFPIDADPRMIALYGAKKTAKVALEAANGILEGIKQSVGAVADVGQFVVKNGLGGLIDIKKASFRASLDTANGGSVSMSLTLKFMNQTQQTLSLNFNFNNPLSSAQDLAKRLLPS